MKTIFSISSLVILMFLTFEGRNQTYLISQGGTVTTCSGSFYDPGGPSGNYSGNQDYTMTFKPATSGAKIRFVFTSFLLESQPACNKDYLRIHDGENTSASQLGPDYCGTTSPGTVTATNASGALTFVFHSNNSINFPGWAAVISCSIPIDLGLWTGGTSSDWNNASNWYNNFVPTNNTNVTIPSLATNWPVFTGDLSTGIACNNIAMDGASELTVTGNLTVGAGTMLTCNANSLITIGGNFSRNGIFTPGTGTVNFNGNSTSTINGSASTWTIFSDGFETNKGWVLSGEFQRNAPQGLGGQTGFPDPAIAYEGSNVIGVDLTGLGNYLGDYEKNLGTRAYQAISPTINCSKYTNISLQFRRWLGVKVNDKVYIDISTNNGSSWTQIWINSGSITESTWSLQTLSLAGANNQAQVKIRFCLGSTTNQQQYCGWNIDDLQITGTVSNQVAFYNLVVNKSNAELVSNSDILIMNDATIKPEAYFSNSIGHVVSVTGNALFEANANGMASYIDNGSTIVSGTTGVQEYLTSERWHLVSSPISDATINTYYDIHLKFYNEPSDTWTYLVLPTTIAMNVGQGYSAWSSDYYNGTTTVTYETATGNLNNSNYYIDTLDYTSGAPLAGFNLLGNPYPCALNWNSNWSLTNMSGWMMIYDNGVYRGYHTNGTPYNGGTPIIPSTQGFWVRALGTGANITIPTSQRVHNNQSFYKESDFIELPIVTLAAEINGMKDEAKVIFSPTASNEFDGQYDLEKFENISEAPTIYTSSNGKDLAVNYLPENYQNVSIPVGFKTGQEGLFQINLESLSNLPTNVHVYLEDLKEGNTVELNENAIYEFAYLPLDEPHRFNLIFKDSSFGIDDPEVNNINIYSFKNVVYISIPETNKGEVVIYDLMGKEISRNTAKGESLTAIPVNNDPGYYLVTVQTGGKFLSQKVFIR